MSSLDARRANALAQETSASGSMTKMVFDISAPVVCHMNLIHYAIIYIVHIIRYFSTAGFLKHLGQPQFFILMELVLLLKEIY